MRWMKRTVSNHSKTYNRANGYENAVIAAIDGGYFKEKFIMAAPVSAAPTIRISKLLVKRTRAAKASTPQATVEGWVAEYRAKQRADVVNG